MLIPLVPGEILYKNKGQYHLLISLCLKYECLLALPNEALLE